MDSETTTTLAPRCWAWDSPSPPAGWLNDSRSDVPQVWLAHLTATTDWVELLTSSLSLDEHKRMERFRLPDDRHRFLVGRGLLRMLAGAQLGVAPESLRFEYSPAGKPRLGGVFGKSRLYFNVSHSGEIILLAFHRSHEVGVDVEQQQPTPELVAVAKRSFSDGQYRQLLAVPDHERHAEFFRAWTRREAALKALGMGLTDDNNFDKGGQIASYDLVLPAGYRGAAALVLGPYLDRQTVE